jgi:serine/threonine protein kinase
MLTIRPGDGPLPGYRLLARLGAGGFGEVWKAEAPGGFEVALKFVPLLDPAGDTEMKALEIIRCIRSAHLMTPWGAWQVGDWLIIGMDLADGSLLDRYREDVARGLLGIPRAELLDYMLEAAKGIDYLNGYRHPVAGGEPVGIQHCDIKPQNLLLVGGSVKVADFGLVRILEHSLTGHTGPLTTAYAAPEFFHFRTSSRSDQYSLAVTYCYLRGGRRPFAGSHAEIVAGHLWREPDLTMLPEAERQVVARALAKAPTGRWPSCRAFIDELRASPPARLVAGLDFGNSTTRLSPGPSSSYDSLPPSPPSPAGAT